MSLITIVVILVVVGVGLYLLSLVPMDGRIYKAIVAVVLLVVILWVLGQFVDLGAFTIGSRHRLR